MPNEAGEAMKRRIARTAVRDLISVLMAIGYDEGNAVEVAESILEEAGRDGLNVNRLWDALEVVAPIPKGT